MILEDEDLTTEEREGLGHTMTGKGLDLPLGDSSHSRLSYDEDNEEMRNVGIQRPPLFNQKARLAPSIKALVKLRARPNDKL